ncbi:MAG: transporter substrate-binding domain-containing protein [Neomegalonema sp.]|nr:transporter substrate-binding domain-containing protein [Neomegalonema sp.]
MFLTLCVLLLSLGVLIANVSDVRAQEPAQQGQASAASEQGGPFRVATIERRPFVMVEPDGSLRGFSVELWRAIAEELGRQSDFTLAPTFADMLAEVQEGGVDVAAANISITAARERVMDFSQPIYSSGLAIITPAEEAGLSFIGLILESGILIWIGAAVLILVIVAHVMWWLERGGEPYFRPWYPEGVWDAFWWAFVIVTMGGFENQRPERIGGRIFAIFWIVAGLFFISTITAKITTALTVAELESDIQGWRDLEGKRVGIAAGTVMERFAESRGINYRPTPDFMDAVRAVERGELDATIGDAAVSKYYVLHQSDGALMIAGDTFAPDMLGFAFPQGSPLREPVNRVLLQLFEDGTYERLRKSYFGAD